MRHGPQPLSLIKEFQKRDSQMWNLKYTCMFIVCFQKCISYFKNGTVLLGRMISGLLHSPWWLAHAERWEENLNVANADYWIHYTYQNEGQVIFRPGAVARSEACPLGMQAAPEFDTHVRHTRPWRLGHKKNSTAILPLPLIKEEQL